MITKTTTLSTIPPVDLTIHNHYISGFGALNGTDADNFHAATVPAYDRGFKSIVYGVGKGRSNFCDHYVSVLDLSTGSVTGTLWANGGASLYTHTQGQTGYYHRSPTSATWPTLTLEPPDWRQNSSRALSLMWPNVRSVVSGLNFAIELPEIKSLIHLVPKLISLARKSKKSTLRKLLSGSSETLLASEFGIRPLLADITALAGVVSYARKQVDNILNNEGKDLLSHCAFPVSFVDSSRTDVAQPYNDADGNHFDVIREYISGEALYTATMRYSIRLDPKIRALAHRLGLLDALGINFNPQVIWDALPWTFVVDWVFKVGDLLGRLKSSNLQPQVVITDYCHSYKRTFRINQYIKFGVTNSPLYPQALVSTWNYSRYIREPFIPNLSVFWETSELSLRESTLGVALALQRLRV